MKCYVHPESDAVGTCTHCGKFICDVCNTEIDGRNYCKNCVPIVFNEMKNKSNESQPAPVVYMNAGGASSSSSSSSSSSGGRGRPRQSCLLHIILFFFTAGIGNIIYFLWARSRDY